MSKFSRFFIIIFVFLLTMLLMTTISKATVNVETCTTSKENGIYGAGTTITITLGLDKQVKGQMPDLQIWFLGSELGAYQSADGPDFGEELSDTITYNYTIKSGDNGKLGIYGLSTAQVKSEDNDNDYFIMDNTLFDKEIHADTTIERSNVKNATYKAVGDEKHNTYLNVSVEGATFNENNTFFVYMSNNKDEKHDEIEFLKEKSNHTVWHENAAIKKSKFGYAEAGVLDNLFAKNNDVYIWICEVDKPHYVPKVIVSAQKVERPDPLPVGSRMKGYFFSENTYTYCYEPYGTNQRKVNLKIGTISDISILRNIRDGKTGCLNKLMEYAKKADSVYTGTVKLGEDDEITSKFDVVNKAYYYVYLELEDENETYYPVEDVSLYQGCVGDTIGKNLFDYLSNDFKWELSDETEGDPTVADGELPDTGIISFVIGGLVLGVVTAIGYVKTRKYKDI